MHNTGDRSYDKKKKMYTGDRPYVKIVRSGDRLGKSSRGIDQSTSAVQRSFDGRKLVTYLYNWSNRNDDTDELFEWFQQIAVGVLALVSSC